MPVSKKRGNNQLILSLETFNTLFIKLKYNKKSNFNYKWYVSQKKIQMFHSSKACATSLAAITAHPVTIALNFLATSAYKNPTIGNDSTKSFKLQISSCLTIFCCSLNSNLVNIRIVISLNLLFLPNIKRKQGRRKQGKRRGDWNLIMESIQTKWWFPAISLSVIDCMSGIIESKLDSKRNWLIILSCDSTIKIGSSKTKKKKKKKKG